eukprot:2996608-Rhodomonas_salina.1
MVSEPYCMSGRKNAATFRFPLPASSPAATDPQTVDKPQVSPASDLRRSRAPPSRPDSMIPLTRSLSRRALIIANSNYDDTR